MIFLAIPSYGNEVHEATMQAVLMAGQEHHYKVQPFSYSLLGSTFNALWCTACHSSGSEYTHFVMLHSDIAPVRRGWLDALMAEYQASGTDVLSVVSPIKNGWGITSTGISFGEWESVRRLTLKELAHMPETFTAADLGYPDNPLAINTGLWVARIRETAGGPVLPWCREFPGFQVDSRVVWRDDEPQWESQPEDWKFGRWLHGRGLKVAATSKIPLRHFGCLPFSNELGKGQWDTDNVYWQHYNDLPADRRAKHDHSRARTPELVATEGATDGST